MADNIRPDMSCVHYRRKGLYLVLTVPFLVLLVSVFVYFRTNDIPGLRDSTHMSRGEVAERGSEKIDILSTRLAEENLTR